MFDLGSLGSVASVVGLIAAIAIAVYQSRQARRAHKEARAERERAASLEDHLARQRWQQLRSLGEQIDTLERDGRYRHQPVDAALHARLKEQYSGLLGVIATSTVSFDSSVVRHWVAIGRLARPWQIAEAISHLEKPKTSQPPAEDEQWLAALLQSGNMVPKPTAVQPPREIDDYVAAFVLVADSVRDELREFLSKGGQSGHSAAVLLDHLACDCLQIQSLDRPGRPVFKAWGWQLGKSFRERFEYYQKQEFWVMANAGQHAQAKLQGFRHLFEVGGDTTSRVLIPKSDAVEGVRAQFPHLVAAAARVFEGRGQFA